MSSLEHKFETESAFAPSETVNGAMPDAGRGARASGRGSWFSRMPVARKLNLAVFGNTLVLALVGAVMLLGTNHLGNGGERQAVIGTIEVRSNNAAIALVDAFEGLETASASSSAAERSAAVARADAALDQAHGALLDPITFAGDAMPAEVGPQLQGFLGAVERLQAELDDAGRDPQALAPLAVRTRALYRDVSGFAIGYHDQVQADADALFGAIASFLTTFLVVLIAGVAVSLFAARHVVRDVTGMITAITLAMQKVASGEADTVIPGGEREDEIGAMARALAVFRQESLALRDLNATRMEEAEERLAQQQLLSQQMRDLRLQKSQLLENLANGFEVSVGELITAVSAASQQLKATSQQMVALSEGSRAQTGEATAAMEQATANVTAAAAATDEFALSISEISRQASSSAELARDASQLVTSANIRMGELSKAALEIGEIVGLIQTIAQRTNLLALNASIEAARGGEAGRGFAVVASEVKELAMQTSRATSSVTGKITAMQDSTRSSANDLTGIVDRISELEQAAVMIASAVDQQSVSGEELARNIDTVAVGSAQVGQRLTALRAASDETGAAADDVVASARALGTHADDLRAKASRFIADIRRSARDLEAGEAA